MDVKECVNAMEDPKAFLENSKELVNKLPEDVVSKEEKVALNAQPRSRGIPSRFPLS